MAVKKRRWSPERRAAFERGRAEPRQVPLASIPIEPELGWDGLTSLAPLELSQPPKIKVIVVWRRALATPPEEAEAEWPANWRLPVAGESVLLANGSGGMIETIQWDLGRRAIRLNIR